MSFLCSCTGRRRKRDESDDRQEYYRRRSRSASRTPPPPLSAVTPKVKRKFPTGIAPTPSVPSDLEENSAAALALSAKKNTNNAAKTKDSNAATAAKVKDPAAKVKTPTPKVTDPKLTTTDPKLKDASKFKDTAKVQFDEKQNNKKKNNRGGAAAAPVQTRTMGTMTAPGAGEVTGYEQTILPRVRKKSPPTVAARMEVTLKSMRRPGPISIPAPPLEDMACGSSGSATPTGGYDGSVSSSDAMSSGGSPRDAQTQCAFSDFSDDESSLLSLGREEGEYESTVSELRDPSADPAGGPEVWDPGFLQHDRIWMDIKSTLMDLISDKDSPAFQELHDSMKPPDLTYCTVFRKMDGTVTHKAREDKKKARHSFGGVPAEKVPGSRSKLNLIALRDDESSDRNRNELRRRSRMDGDEMDYEDLTPGSEYDDKLFTPDDEVTEYYFGRRSSSEPDVPFQSSETQLAPDAKITEFYFGQGASSDMDIPMRKSDSQITLRSFQGGTTSEALRSSMSAIWPTPTRGEKIGGSAVELTVPRTETDLPDKKVETATSTEDGDETQPSVENTQNVSVKEESKVETRLEEQNVQTEIVAEATEVETVLSEQLSEAAPEVKMRQKITSRPFDRSMSESSSRGVREGTPVVQDLKTQKELWRQGVAFEGKDFEIGDAELESMEVEPVSPELHEKNRHHVKRVTRRKETSQLRSFSLDYEKRSPKVARKRPGRPIVVQPYSPTRTSQPPAKDHSKHKLKLKHEDRIDDTSSSVDDADSGDASKLATSADDASEISGEPVLPDSAVASLARDKKGVKSSSPEETDSKLSPTDIVGPTTELRSPSMVRSVVAGRFTIETKQTQGRSIDSRKVDQNLQEATSPDQLSELSSGSANEESKTNSQSVPKTSLISEKPKEKPKKHQEPSPFPAIDAESRFVSKPSEVKRSGKIELISVPPDDEDSEDTKVRRTKKTRNVGRFLPRGGLKEIKTEETPTSYIPEEHSHATDLPDIGREIKKQESESSTTEPDLVLGHGSPHGSVDAQLLKFGNSLEDSMSKGSPDVIVQCFGEVSAASEDKKQLEELGESGSFEDFKARGGAFEKSATLFSAASTSVETVIAATKTKSELLEDDGLGSMDVDDVESKTDLETGNDAKQEKDDVKDGRNLTKRDLVEKYLPVRDSIERVTSAVVKTQYLRASNIESLPSKTETLVETVDSKKSSEPNVSVVERIFSDTATGNEDGITLNDSLKQVSNAPNVGTILPSGSSEPTFDSRKSLEAADKDIPQSPVLKETRGSGIEELLPSGFSENLVTSSNSSAALSGTSSGSFPEDIVPLLSPTSSSPPEFSPRSTSAGNGDSFLPGSGCTSPKRISSGSDSVHPLPKVETTIDETPLRYRPPEVTSVTTSPSTTTTTTSRTPRVRLSDIIITGSGEEKLLALSTSPVNDIFLSDVSPDRRSVSSSPAFEQSDFTKQEGVAPDEKIPQTTRDLPAGSVLSTKPQPQISDGSTICPPTIPGPASNVDSGEVISSENKISDETSESSASPAVSQEKTGGNILSSLVEICDRFLPSSGKNVTSSKLLSTSDVKDETRVDKSDEQVQSEEKDVEKDETKEKSPEKADALEGKSGKNGTKLKKTAKKGEKSEKKGEKSEKKTSKSKASAKAELPPFPPPDRPIRIAVRPSERMRALSKTSPTTQTSDSSDAVELSSDRESIPKAGPVSTDSVSEYIPSDVKQKEAQGTDEAKQVTSVIDNATERKLESTVERLSTVVLPDSHIVSTPVVSQTSDETLKPIEKCEKTRDSITAFADKIDRETQKIVDVPEMSAEIKFTDAISKEPSKRSEKISPGRDSLEETSIQPVRKTPRDSLEKEIPKEISGITLESPLPSPKDSLEAQSRRDSELTIDSIHRDPLSDLVPKTKSQSPCDSLDENTSTLVSETEKADPNIGDGVTSKSTPRDSLEGSPTKSLADVGPVKRASTVKSVDEDQILSFSSVWSPRISMQQASERITSPVSETVESRSATIIDARPFLAPSYSAEIAPPPWIADAIPEPPAAVPVSSPPRGSFEEGVLEQPAAHVQASQLAASVGPSVPQNSSPIISPRDSFEGPSKQISKQLDRAASGENSLRDDVSSISSVTSPRDSLSSKRESSTTISDRLSTTDTSVIDDILGVGSIPLPKEWTDSPRASGSIPDSTPVRASLAVEEGLSSSSATSPRDSFEENQAKRILDPVPESPRVSQVVSMSRDSVASFSPLSTPRDSLDFGQQTKPSDSVPETPHRQSLVDSIKTGTSKAGSSNVRDSFGSEKSSSPRISQKEITESFQKYFSSLDPTLAKLRDSQMSTGSGDSRRSAASDSDFDIIDFAEPDLMVLTDLPEERHPPEQGAPTRTSNLPTEIPRPERSQSMLSGGFDIMYIDTSSFDDDKTPKPTSESESSPTREVAKVMEELASVLENAEKGFETDTSSVSSRHDSTPVVADRGSSKEKESDKSTPTITEETEKVSAETQLQKDRDVFRKIAESSMDVDLDIEASFEAMVNSLLTPRSSGITDENKKEEAKKSDSPNTSGVGEVTDDRMSIKNDENDPKSAAMKTESRIDRESATQFDDKTIVPQDKENPVVIEKLAQDSISDDNQKTVSVPKPDEESDIKAKELENKVRQGPKGETGIRESTFGLAKKVQDILRRTPSIESQPDDGFKISKSSVKHLSKTSSTDVVDAFSNESRICESSGKTSNEEEPTQKMVDQALESKDSLETNNKFESVKDDEMLITLEKHAKTLEATNSNITTVTPEDISAIQKTSGQEIPEEKTSERKDKEIQKLKKTKDTTSVIQTKLASDQISENDENKQTDKKSACTDVEESSEKLNNMLEKEVPTPSNEKSHDKEADSSVKEQFVQTDSKRRSKTKSKSLSQEKADLFDALSVAVEKNIPLPPDLESLETDLERDTLKNEKQSEEKSETITSINEATSQANLGHSTENIQNVITPKIELKENEEEKIPDKRRAGDWSKSFSLGSRGSLDKFEDEKEKIQTTVRPEVKRTISTDSALEKKSQKSVKSKVITKSFSKNGEDRTGFPTGSATGDKVDEKPIPIYSEEVIDIDEESISRASKRSSKSRSISHEDKEKQSTGIKAEPCDNKEIAGNENIPLATERKKSSSVPPTETDVSSQKAEDSGVEEDALQDHSESGKEPAKEKKQSSKKSKSRSREDVNSEELADLIQQQLLSIASGQVDDSQLEWTGPLRREKKSRKSVKTSKSRGEETDGQIDSSVVLPDDHSVQVEQNIEPRSDVESASAEDISPKTGLRRLKSRSKSREDDATCEKIPVDVISSPESTSRKESSPEKPKSILKSSSKEKVPVESPPVTAEINISQQENLPPFGDPFSLRTAGAAIDGLKRSDSKSSTEGVTSTSPEIQHHLVKSSSFERTQDKFGEDPLWEDRERRNIRKIKSRSSSREDEQPLPDSSFDEKYVTSITESKPREGMNEFSEFAFSEPRSPRSLRRRSSSKSVSFEDDVILELVEDEIAEVSQMDNTESREDLESSEKPRKSKLERRKSPKKKSKSRSSDERQDLVFDSSFEVIPEDAPIFTEDRVNESLENVESYVKESPDSKYGQDNLKSKSKSLTPEKSMPSETSSEFSRQISDNRDDLDCFPIEENEKGKIERRKSPKKKSKSKTYDQGDVCSPTLQLLKDRSLRYVVTPDRELGPGNRSSETLQQQDFAAASTIDATESGSEFDFFVKERSSKDKLERRKSPKKKSKPKLSGTDEEDITSPEILIARVDEYFSSTSGTDVKKSESDFQDEKPFTVIERRKSPKKKSKSKNVENDEQVAFVGGATIIENPSAVPKDEQLHHSKEISQQLDETFEESWLQQPRVERRKSPKKKSKSSNQESEIPRSAPAGGDFYLPTVPAFQIDKPEALFEFSREPQEMPTEKTPALDSESKTQNAREKVAIDGDSSMSVSEEKPTKTKSKSRSKSSDIESDRTIERRSSTHSQLEVEISPSKQEKPEKMKSREKTKSREQADVIHTSTGKTSQDGVTSPPPARDNANLSEHGGAALVFENAPITQTENISSSSDTTRAENIQPVGAPSLDRIIVTQDSSESTNRLSSTSMLYPKSIDFFTTITSSRPESLEGHFPLSLPPSRTSLELLAQKSTESLASNVSWNLPPKVDVRTMFVGNVTSPSKSDNEIVDFFTEQSTGIPSVEGGLKERDSSDSSKPQSIETLPSKSLSFEEALKSYREKNKKSEDESVSEVRPKPPPIENVSSTSGGSLELVSSRSIEEPVTLVSSPIKGVSVEGLSKKSVSRTSSTSSEKLVSKTSRSFEKSFEIPRSPEIVEKDGTFAATPSHSKPPSRANSTTSDKTIAKTQSFEISIEQPVSWDVEHFDLEQTSSIISRSKPVSRSSSTTSENVITPGEALASSETENITKENDSSKVSHSKPPSRTSSVASDKSISKHFQSLEKSSERPLSLVASFEADSMSSTSRIKPQSRSSSTASDKSILKTKGSVEKILKQTSASDVEISEIQPASPVILRSKPPSRSSSTTSEKVASKVHSFDEAGPSISQDQTTEITTRSGNIEREPEGVPIAVSAPLRWSAALPENIDLSQDPTEDQEEQQGEAEEEDRGTEKLELKSLVPRAKSPALRKKVIPAEGKRDVSEIPSTTTNMPEKDMKNEGSETLMEETKPPVLSASLQAESETSIPTESKTSTESPSKEADAKTSTVGHKNIDALESKPVPTPKKKEKSTAQETIIPGAKSSPIPQRKQPASQSESESNVPKSFVQETRIPSAKASPLPQKKTTTSEPKSETRGQETQSTAVKSSPVPQRKATASQQKSDTPGEERRLTAAKSSPVPKKKTLPAETQSQESKVTAAKSSPVPKKKNISSETQGQESRLPAAKSSPAPQKKSIPSETQSQEAKLAAAKSSPAPQKKPTPSETQITETKSTAAKASLAPQKKSIPSETQSQEAKLTAAKPSPAPQKKPVQSETQSQEAKPTAAKSSPAPQKKPTPSETQIPETKPTAAKSSPAPQKKPSPSSPPKPETSPTTSEPKTKPRSVPETKVTAAAPAAMSAGETVRSAVRSVLDAAKQMLGVETPPSPRGRREKSRSPGRGVEPPSADLAAAAAPSPAARRRRARARRRAAAAEASTEVHPSSARSSIAGPLDWAAEVDAELPLDEEGDEEDEAAPPTPSSGRRKRKRHRRKRVRAAESGPALATPAPAATAPPAAAAAPTTAAAIAPPARIKRLKSCEEDSSDAAGVSSSEAAQPPRRPAAAASSPPLSPRSSTAAPDDDPTPWSVVRSRRHRRSRPRRPSTLRPTATATTAQPPRKTPSADGGGGSSDGGGFRFQEPPPREGAGLRLSSGSESAQVFFFEGGDSPAR